MSTVTLSQPHFEYISALKALGMASHPLTTALPAFHASLTLFAIVSSRVGGEGADARARAVQLRQRLAPRGHGEVAATWAREDEETFALAGAGAAFGFGVGVADLGAGEAAHVDLGGREAQRSVALVHEVRPDIGVGQRAGPQ